MNEPQGLQLIEFSMVARLSFTESMIPNINPDLQNKKKPMRKTTKYRGHILRQCSEETRSLLYYLFVRELSLTSYQDESNIFLYFDINN